MTWFVFVLLLICLCAVSAAPPHSQDHRSAQPFVFGAIGGLSDVVASRLLTAEDYATSSSIHDQHKLSVQSTSVSLDTPTFIPLGMQQIATGDLFQAYTYLWNQLKPNRGNFLQYPYAFQTSSGQSYPDGALVAVHPLQSVGGFSFVQSSTTIQLARGKVLYDSSIAILSVSGLFNGAVRDLTYESSSYCSALKDYIVGKWTSCYTSAEYLAAQAANPAFEQSSIVMVTPADLAAGFLFFDGVSGGTSQRRFGSLTIPDIYQNSQQLVVQQLGNVGKRQISAFVQGGGTLIATGKGVLVAQGLGLSAGATFSSSQVLAVTGTRALLTGCQAINASSITTTATEADWRARALCFSPPRPTDATLASASLYNSPVLTALGSTMQAAAWFAAGTNVTYSLSDSVTGVPTAVTITGQQYPALMSAQLGTGQVVLQMFNPAANSRSYAWYYNALFLANARPLLLDAYVAGSSSAVLPALEQFALTIQVNLTNVYNYALRNVSVVMWIAAGTIPLQIPGACRVYNASALASLASAATSGSSTALLTVASFAGGIVAPSRFFSSAMLCGAPAIGGDSSLAPFALVSYSVQLFIQDIMITQAQNGIPVLQPRVSFRDDARNGAVVLMDSGAVTINTFEAAYLSVEMNPDPAGLYPIPGSGAFIDNVLTAENKGATQALQVQFVSIFPLISPVFDGSNQRKISHALDFDFAYYQRSTNQVADYTYPFTSPAVPYSGPQSEGRQMDWLDWQLLGNRGNYMVGDWDTPVRNLKQARNASFPSQPLRVNLSSIGNSQLTTTTTTDQMVLGEWFFPDSATFYELATPRLLAFLDTTEPLAFASYNASGRTFLQGRPEVWSGEGTKHTLLAWRLASSGDRMRSNLLMLHVDAYFYNVTQQYPLPAGVSSAGALFTADRFMNRALPTSPCIARLGQQQPNLVHPGYFSPNYATGYNQPAGLRAGEYANSMLSLCDQQRHTSSWDSVVADTGAQVQRTHYLVPLTDNPEVVTGDDAMYFVRDLTVLPQQEWYYDPGTLEANPDYGTYKEVRLIWTYRCEFLMSPASTLKGGRVTVSLTDGAAVGWPAGFDAIAADSVTVQPDQVAVVSTGQISPTSFWFTFKRGNQPYEGYGKDSQMAFSIERLQATAAQSSLNITITIESLLYDLSQPAPHETFLPVSGMPLVSTLQRTLAMSLPALKMTYVLSRGAAGNESFMQPFENVEPFARIGTYSQELMRHATVFADPEVHFNKPLGGQGVVGKGGDLVWLSNIGISPIPFAEYLTTGAKQLIPSSAQNTRMEWSDLWGRRYAQPIRSTYPDNAPLPGPVRNFMMSTTFEMLAPASNVRSMIWQSDQPQTLRTQVKLTNNYRKYFDSTTCAANMLFQAGNGGATIFDRNIPSTVSSLSVSDRQQFVGLTHRAQYGPCLAQAGSILEAQTLTDPQRALITNASLCMTGPNWYATCPTIASLPHLKHYDAVEAPGKSGFQWNSMLQVQSHYPPSYITASMSDLTETDYEDDAFLKGYPWHFDNLLPNTDSGIIKPHNIIAFPVYKGLGFLSSYSKTLTHPKFIGQVGWWSDNLQNRDETLMAGQVVSPMATSVGFPDMTLEPRGPGWIRADVLQPSQHAKLKNIYSCNFNRHRIVMDPVTHRMSSPANTYINNVVPIDPTLNINDVRLTGYVCDLNQGPYTPQNISQFNNYLSTDSSSDWLYFASGLRGQALENINVLSSLAPHPTARQEGMTKVVEGGLFVYWNPSLGPNTFEVVENPVSIVMARRTDLLLRHNAMPSTTSTFKSTVIHTLQMSDVAEIGRTWDSPIYYDYHGFGDSSVSVYVGGFKGSSSIIYPGDQTYVEVVFYNNAGFDWNLKAGAINATELGLAAINANDLLYNLKHAIQAPQSYNFMQIHFDNPELAQWVTVKPSTHNVDTAPLFFDFQNINVATIRDGFKGRYFYLVTVDPNIPAKFRGVLQRVSLQLKPEFFDRLPGMNDPTGTAFQAQQVCWSIPSFAFGLPFASDSAYSGRVFWTSGHALLPQLVHHIDKTHAPQGACIVAPTDVSALAQLTGAPEVLIASVQTFWRTLQTTCRRVPFSVTSDGLYNKVTFNLTAMGNQFPFPPASSPGPEVADIILMLMTYADVMLPGRMLVSDLSSVGFTDDSGASKTGVTTDITAVTAVGPYLQISVAATLFDTAMVPLANQTATLNYDAAGFLRLSFSAVNVGNGFAYNTVLSFGIAQSLVVVDAGMFAHTVIPAPLSDSLPGTPLSVLALQTGMTLVPGEPLLCVVLLRYSGAVAGDITVAGTRLFLNASVGMFDLSLVPGQFSIKQDLATQFVMPIAQAQPAAASTWWMWPLVGAAAFVAALLLLFLYRRKRTMHGQGGVELLDVPMDNVVMDGPTPIVAPPLGPVRHKVADMHYLMAGSRGLKIKDGNPTAVATADDLADEDQAAGGGSAGMAGLCNWLTCNDADDTLGASGQSRRTRCNKCSCCEIM